MSNRRSLVGSRGPATAILIALAVALPVAAQEEPGVVSKWELTFGSVFTSVDTDIRADANRLDLGTDIDFEDALGFDDTETLLRLSVRRQIRRRHFAIVDIQKMSRSSARDIPFEIEFQDIVFPSSVRVAADWDMQLFDVRYSYMPVLKENTAFGLTAGVGRWDYDVVLSATEEITGRDLVSEVDIDEIVPLFGIGYRHQFNSKFRFNANLLALSFDVGSTSGTIVEGALGFAYWFHRNVGLAVSFDYLNADVEFEDDSSFLGNVEYELSGFQFYIPVRFD
jgi:hypothetical protein